MPDLVVHQQIERDALFGRPTAQPERLLLAADQPDLLARGDAAQRRTGRGDQLDAGVARQVPGHVGVDQAGVEQRVDLLGGHLEFGHPGPARGDHVLRTVFVGSQPDRRGLHPQRHVLRHQGDGFALGRQVQRASQNPGVVGVIAESGREDRRIRVIELDMQGAGGYLALLANGYRGIQAAVFDPQVVQHAQCLPGEISQFGVVTLGFQLPDDHQRQHDLVLGELRQRPRDRTAERRCRSRRSGGRSLLRNPNPQDLTGIRRGSTLHAALLGRRRGGGTA